VLADKQITIYSAARCSAQLDQNGTIAASEQLIPARSMRTVVYQSHIVTTQIRGSVRLLNTKRFMLKVMKLPEPLAARDRGGVWFTLAIRRSDDLFQNAIAPVIWTGEKVISGCAILF
jgi:hypothetical protein